MWSCLALWANKNKDVGENPPWKRRVSEAGWIASL